MIKDTDKKIQLKERHRVRKIPCSLWHSACQAPPCAHQTRSSLNPILWGFSWRLQRGTRSGTNDESCRHDSSLTPFPVPLWRTGNRVENSKFPSMAWTFWWPAPIWSPPGIILLEAKTVLAPRKLQRRLELCQELEQKLTLVLFTT